MNEFKEFYEIYSKNIYRYLFFLTKSEMDAEDLMQETFIVAIKNINKFKGESSLNTWLFAIARNLYLNWIRKQQKNKHINIDSVSDFLHDKKQCENQIIEKESTIEIFNTIILLKEEYREILLFRLVEELSFKEIGNILGKSETFVRVKFHRGKIKLQELIKIRMEKGYE